MTKRLKSKHKVDRRLKVNLWGRPKSPFNSRYKNKPINKKDLNKFVNFLISSLDQIGFLQPHHKRKSMIENIRTIFHKMNLSDKEMRILLGIFGSLKDKKVD